MIGVKPSQVPWLLGVLLALSGGPAVAHQVTGVRAAPALPVVGEPVVLTVVGYFSDGCERTTSASAQVAEHRIAASVQVVGPSPGTGCPEVLTPFEQTVEVAGLAAGNYIIDVELLIDEFGQQWTELFPAASELFVHRGRVWYQLRPESWFMEDCPVCDHIPIQLPMTGTFELLIVGPGDVFNFYDIRNAKFHAEGYEVTGDGRYQFSPPQIAGEQYMRLDAAVNRETGLVLDSGMVPLSKTAEFPVIDIELAEQTQSITRVYRLRILAAPVSVLPPPDLDEDGDVDGDDLVVFQQCATGPELGPPVLGCEAADLDSDKDVDQSDFGIFQRCYRGSGTAADPACAN